MSLTTRTQITDLPLTVAEHLDSLCDRFEAACEGGLRPGIGDYLEGVEGPARATLARELILLDLHYRHRRAEVLQVTDYDAVNPDRESNWLTRAVADLTDRPALPVLPGYEILGELGRGGMGVVYKAVDESLGRHVALKVLSHSRQVGPIQLIRFQREARAAALLHHTNIVPVFAVGLHEDVHFYAMQYIDGQSLDAVLREIIRLRRDTGAEKTIPQVRTDNISASLASGLLIHRFRTQPIQADLDTATPTPIAEPGAPSGATGSSTGAEIPPEDGSSSISSLLRPKEGDYYRSIARLGVQAAEALAYAHSHGVLHRDIKPANLLLDLQGTIWVTDFGLSKAAGSEELTSPGEVVGTLRYMAPERFQGKADPRCDVYSLGVTLYEMLTLEPAFTTSHRVELINKILHVEPVRPRTLEPQIPRDLETIVLKAIAKNPSHRFSSATELSRELGRFIDGRPIRSRRVSVPERLWRWSRRNPAVAMLVLLAATLTTVLAIGSTTAAWQFRKQRDAVRIEESKTRSELGRSLLLQARAARYSSQPGRRSDALETLRKAARIAHEIGAPPDHFANLRDEAIAAMALAEDRPTRTWTGLDVTNYTATFSIADDRYVVLGKDGSIRVHQLSNGSLVRVVGSDRPAARSWPQLLRGGRFLRVLSGSSQLELWDLERAEIPAAWPADVRCATIRADGAQVAALRSDGELRVYGVPAVTEASRCRLGLDVPERLSYSDMSLAEDGRRLALIRPDKTIARVYEVATGRVVRDVKLPPIYLSSALALDRNGRLLAIVHDRAVSVYDLADGEQIALLQVHQAEGIEAMFQPGGDLLVIRGWDFMTRLWDPIRGRLLLTLQGNFLDWAEHGLGLAVGRHRQLVLHEIESAGERRTIDCRMLDDRARATASAFWRIAYSPDGQLIALAMRPGVVIARASDGAALAHLKIGHCDEVLFLPGGALLTYNDLGICRWPLQYLSGGRVRMGPAEPLTLIGQGDGYHLNRLAASASGRLLGATLPRQGRTVLLDPDQPWRQTWLGPHQYLIDLAVSADGRWAATTDMGPTPSRQLKVWETATGRLLAQVPVLRYAHVTFSPDGRWLGVGNATGYRFLRAGSWTPGATIDLGVDTGSGVLAFHPSSRIAAILESNASTVRLVEVETGRALASLDAADRSVTSSVVFSPDGRFVAAAKSDIRVDVWDLTKIRRGLEEMNLASGFPDGFGATAASGNAPTVERILLEGADPAAIRFLRARQTLRRAWFALRPRSAGGFWKAWELATCVRLRSGKWKARLPRQSPPSSGAPLAPSKASST